AAGAPPPAHLGQQRCRHARAELVDRSDLVDAELPKKRRHAVEFVDGLTARLAAAQVYLILAPVDVGQRTQHVGRVPQRVLVALADERWRAGRTLHCDLPPGTTT